ncbi:hypothetical protein [Streptomyces prasinopilosus]|uniref:Lipoprotein n=1 Tax=Streptomyces prasinopilosus TaxID=67344 RepID=A0A1G6QNK5_9ACTN|nr:hypothetical protein [Streptomyces prasinopilosus]SDC93801.1 hypothetical protein SAMN05216505_104195 [Streptomyces prasinopilosus]
MMNRRLRKALVVTTALTAGLLMTACQNEDTGDNASAVSAASSAPAAGAEAAGSGTGKGVSGSFKNGKVTHLAPGKYLVSVPGKTDQAFFVSEETKIWGAGGICGDAQGQSATQCTEAELETAAKKGAVSADVEMKDGAAVSVTEQPAGGGSGSTGQPGSAEGVAEGEGVSGTWFGNVSYLAPGKYTVSDTKGTEQAFFVSEETKIWGAGGICGDAQGQSATQCTEAELEAAARKGVGAEVTLSNGIATKIVEDA